MIENMTTQEKSKALLEIAGIDEVLADLVMHYRGATYTCVARDYYIDIYNMANMEIAAHVVEWAYDNKLISPDKINDICFNFVMVRSGIVLDLILELAIKAGMVKQ